MFQWPGLGGLSGVETLQTRGNCGCQWIVNRIETVKCLRRLPQKKKKQKTFLNNFEHQLTNGQNAVI